MLVQVSEREAVENLPQERPLSALFDNVDKLCGFGLIRGRAEKGSACCNTTAL